MSVRFPEHLIDDEAALPGVSNPLELRWHRDRTYRSWEESKDLAASWGLSQRLAGQIQRWLIFNGISARREIPAVWKNEDQAKRSFERWNEKNPHRR